MKRSLVVVLTIAMLLFAFVGTAVASEQDDAAARLQGFGIVEGYPDGSMGLDRDITRAEFAKIAVLAKGMGEAAELLKGSASQFSDVQANVWYTGWINVAAANGIVQGDPVGTFRPNDNISNAEAVAMILRVLGYNDNLIGSWPMNYLVKGADLGITTGLVTDANAKANRGVVFSMLNRALDENVVKWDSDEADFAYRIENGSKYTLLQQMLSAKEEAKGRVIATYRTDSKLKENEIRIDGEDSGKYTLMINADVDWLLGLEVTLKHDDKDVYYVGVDTDEDDIIFDTVDDFVAGTGDDADVVTLYVEDDDFDLTDDAVVFVNFSSGTLAAGQYGKFVLDDGDVAFAVVFAFEADYTAGVISDFDGEIVEYWVDDLDELDIDLDEWDEVYIFNSKLQLVDEDAIEVDSLLYGWKDDDELYLVIAGETVEGVLDRVRSDSVRIDGTSYDVADFGTVSANEDDDVYFYDSANGIETAEDLAGTEVVALLDLNGEVRHIRGDAESTSGDQYGLVTNAYASGADYVLRVYTQNDKTVVYPVDDKADYNVFKGYFDAGNTTYIPIKYAVNRDGEIKDIEIVAAGLTSNGPEDLDYFHGSTYLASNVANITGNFKADEDDKYITGDNTGKHFVTNSTVIMKYQGADNEDVISWKDIEGKSGENTKAFILGAPGKNAKFVVIYNNYGDIADETEYGLVIDKPYYEDGDWKALVDVAGSGEVEYVLGSRNDVAKGDLIAFTVAAGDEISTPLVDRIQKSAASGSVYESVYVIVTEVDGNYIEVEDQAGNTHNYRFTADTVIYQVDDEGNLDGAIRQSRVRKGDAIVILADKEDGKTDFLRVVLKVNEWQKKDFR